MRVFTRTSDPVLHSHPHMSGKGRREDEEVDAQRDNVHKMSFITSRLRCYRPTLPFSAGHEVSLVAARLI